MTITPQTKKIVIISLAVILVIFLSVLSSLSPEISSRIFRPTIPLITAPTTTISPSRILPEVSPVVPKGTNYQAITSQGNSDLSQTEIQKLKPDLPITIKDFKTSLNQTTTINIFTISSEPQSLIHIEIYGVNFNHPELSESDAIAFKESFQQAKKSLAAKNINIKNLQIVFGTRQYIQDTAKYWVSAFGLLN